MTRGRFTFIIICSALSNLAGNSYFAAESTAMKISWAQQRIIISTDKSSKFDSDKIYESSSREIQKKTIASVARVSEAQAASSDQSTDVQSSVKINKPLFVAAMAVTSGISILLLWVLFRRPTSEPETVAELPPVSEPEDTPEVEVETGEVVASSITTTDYSPPAISLTKDLLDAESQKNSIADKLSARDSLLSVNSSQDRINVVFELTKDLLQSDRNIRRKAIWELAKLGDSRVIEPLMAIMPQANSVDKSLIIKAITQITNRSFKPVNAKLFAMLNDDNPEVRVNAILDLTTFYKFIAPITQQLLQMQLDDNQEVRDRASQALQDLNLDDSVSMLQDYADQQIGEIAVRDKNQA
ncbi:MAG: HEAT repeat domain-containing protein [Cyanobacteria bacterium P01_G01_bin.67]